VPCEICDDVLQSRLDLRDVSLIGTRMRNTDVQHKKAVHDWSMLCTTCLQTFQDGFAALEVSARGV